MSVPTDTRAFPPGSTLEEGIARLQQVMEDAPAAAEATAIEAVRNEFRKNQRKIVVAVALVIGIIVVGGTIVNVLLFQQVAAQTASNADQDQALRRSQDTLDAFRGQLDVANASLRAQGLPTISAPTNPVPGSPEQAQLITAAGTATTLANLPKTVMAAPTPQNLASAVADYVAAHRGDFAPSPDAIIAGVAAYFAQNKLPEGPAGPEGPQGTQGIPGEPGQAPTADEIRAAFRDEITANPQLLCPQGGTYTSRAVVTQDSTGTLRATPQFGCFGEDGEVITPPPTPTDPGGGGNTGGGGAATSPPNTSGGTSPEPQVPQGTSTAPVTPSPTPEPVAPSTEPSAPAPTTQPALPGLLGIL